MNKKTVSLIAMIVSVLIVFFGILVMAGSLGGDTGYASSAYLYDSGYASFGADFYTYVSNNAAEAASASRTIASNLDAISQLLKNACGIFLMGFGLLSLCHFTMIWLGEKKEDEVQQIEEAPEAPAQEAETEPETISF